MKIKRQLFPLILVGMFFLIIALGMAKGYWQTNGGGGRGNRSASVSQVDSFYVMGAAL